MVLFVASSIDPLRLVFQVWPSFQKDSTKLIWNKFFWKWNCCWSIYWRANLQSCITTGIEVTLMCRRECFHNRIKEDSNLDMTGLQTHQMQCFQYCLFCCNIFSALCRLHKHFHHKMASTLAESMAEFCFTDLILQYVLLSHTDFELYRK